MERSPQFLIKILPCLLGLFSLLGFLFYFILFVYLFIYFIIKDLVLNPDYDSWLTIGVVSV